MVEAAAGDEGGQVPDDWLQTTSQGAGPTRDRAGERPRPVCRQRGPIETVHAASSCLALIAAPGRVTEFETTVGQELLSKDSCGLGVRPLLFGARTRHEAFAGQ